jgi:cytochrome P450
VFGAEKRVGPAYEELPGEDGWPLVGSLPAFTRDPLAFLEDLVREHGRIARFRMASLPYVLVAEPAALEQVLVTKDEAFEKHDYLRFTLGDALGDGLLVAEGDDWRTQRRLAQPSFTPKRVRTYAPAMAEQARRIADAWAREPDRRLHDDMTLLTLRIAAETLFGVAVDEEADAIGAALDDVMARFSARNRVLSMVPKSVPLPANRRYQRGVDRLHGIVEDLIDERLAAAEGGLPEGEDLMARLVRAWRAREAELDRDRLRDELVTFLVAGHETTALALTWTLWLLGNHAEVQARLADQLDAALDDGRATPAALDRVPLLDAVVEESMRVLPPVWAFGRQATEDVEVLGHELPEGTQVMVPQWVVHRDPARWERPTRFEPDRWLDGRADQAPRFAHLPFGGGPRTCIGDAFARLEARVCLAELLRRFAVDSAARERPALDPSITLRPGEPVLARVEQR